MTEQKHILYSPVDVDDAEFADVNREPTEDEIEFQKFKDEFKQANEYAKVSCYRQPTTSDGRPGQKNLTFLFEAGVEEFSFSQLAGRLRDEYGTGTYRIQLRDKDNLLKMNRAVSIEAPKIAGDDNTPGNIIALVSRALQEQQVRTENMFRQLVGPQTGGDAIDQIVKISAAIAPILTALGISRPETVLQKTLVEQLTEFKMIKELFGGDDDGGALGGDANLYSLLSDTVKAFGGPIAAALAAGAESGELTTEGVAALPAPGTTDAEKAVAAEQHNVAMRKNIHILIQNAKLKIPPEMFAQILVNNTPEDKEDELWEFISAENCVDTIIGLEPAAEPYREWFDALRVAVIELMADSEEKSGFETAIDNHIANELQDDPGKSKVPESQTVAGVEVSKDTPTSDGKSDGNPPGDT